MKGRKHRIGWISAALALAALPVTLAACGGGGDKAKSGGTLEVIFADDVDSIDPGVTYFVPGYMVSYNTQRPLFSWKPDDVTQPSPDLATSDAEVSEDGKKVTVAIRDDVKFSPPVNRVVTTKDVKYAVERGFAPAVQNGYVGTYMGDLEGLKAFTSGKADDISGIETPDDTTIVFNLAEGTGATFAQALSLPASAPVPPEYAKDFDAKSPSTYAANVVATGPYMVENDDSGKVTGYKAGKSITMVRNPNWDKDTDYRPAYADEIEISEGNDPVVASRQILQGESQVNGDFSVPPEVLKPALKQNKDQTSLDDSGGNRYVALNTAEPPFDDANVRKAVAAAADRDALRLTRGGEIIGDVATHFIPPGLPGFEEAGGTEGPGEDFLANPKGDDALAASYMKKAGYDSGKYDGKDKVLLVGDSEAPADRVSEIVRDELTKLGFDVNFRLAPRDAVITKFCGVPDADVAVCPTGAWGKDFNDGQTILDPTFNGANILPTNNVNWSQLDDSKINEAMDKAQLIVDLDDRAQAWGDIDKQVTATAAAVPWVWDKNSNVRSKNVNGVINKFLGQWDLSFTSIE